MSMVEKLLRLHRWQLEERRRYLTGLEALAERLRADALRLTADPDAAVEAPDPARPRDAEGYASSRKSVERRAKLEHSITEIESQIVEARAAVAAAESEVAHYEVAAAQPTTGKSGAAIYGRRLRDPLRSPLARRYGG